MAKHIEGVQYWLTEWIPDYSCLSSLYLYKPESEMKRNRLGVVTIAISYSWLNCAVLSQFDKQGHLMLYALL